MQTGIVKDKYRTDLHVLTIAAPGFKSNNHVTNKLTHFQAAVVLGDELYTPLRLLLTAFSAFCLTQRVHYRLVNIIFKYQAL